MHRMMVTSRAYRMASMTNDEAPATAPSDELFSRFSRRRLDAESIRDTLLVLGGNLERGMGGQHPFPPQQKWDFTQHKPFKAVYETNLRSVYLMTQRIQRHPLMATFDGPDTGASTGRRVTSTTTLQALYFLNDPFVHAQAERIAARVLAARSNQEARVRLTYESLFSRLPTADELALGTVYLGKSGTEDPVPSGVPVWTSYVRALIRTNEFVYVD
jgi:hypothetical protein